MSNLLHVPEDQELLERSRNGDQSAFRMLIERYENQVAATVISMLGPGDSADDVGQETFVRFYRALERFRGESTLGTYLTKIAMNLSLNELKKRQRWRRFFTSENLDAYKDDVRLADEDAGHASFADVQLVHRALERLAPEFRSVIVLRLIQGYSTRETAEILEIPGGTVLSRLSRGQEKLREIITEMQEET